MKGIYVVRMDGTGKMALKSLSEGRTLCRGRGR